MNHMLDDCYYNMAAKAMMKELNCVLPHLPQEHHQNLTICKPDAAKKAKKLFLRNYFHLKEICKVPCMRMTSHWGLVDTQPYTDWSSGTKQNKSYMRIYLKSTVQHIQTVTDYSVITMLGGMRGE